MNNFNPDQNPHILSNLERSEGGSGGFGSSNKNEVRDIRADAIEDEDLEELPSLYQEAEGINTEIPVKATVEGEEEDQELPLLEDEPNFDIDPETGLSKALTEINNLQAQIQSLEDRYQEIQSEIKAARDLEKINLENSLQENETNLNQIYIDIFRIAKAKGEFTGSEEHKTRIKKYLEQYQDHEVLSKIKVKFDGFKSRIQDLTTKLEAFDTETESQIQAKVEAEKFSLQESLAKAQGEYNGSEAEANDKKVLLERELQEKLTKPDELFSEDNIASIFAIYGLQEGQTKIKALKQESDRAIEQATRDEIQDKILNEVYRAILYQPELAEAIVIDLTPKLEALLRDLDQNSTEYKEIQRILGLQTQGRPLTGAEKLAALVHSQNPKLNNLVFWYQSSDGEERTTAEILANNPNLAQYVSEETDKEYQRKIKEQKLNPHFTREAQNLETGIKERISTQFEIAKENQINTLGQEKDSLSGEQFDLEYAEVQLTTLEDETTKAESDTTVFNAKISELGDGKFKFEGGRFNSVENSDIVQEQQNIAQQSEGVKQSIKGLIQSMDGVPANIKTILTQEQDPRQIIPNIQSQIDTIKNKKRYKFTFGLWGGGKIKALTQLQNSLQDDITQYSNLELQRLENKAQYEANNQSRNELNQLYQALPDRIKNSLTRLENSNSETIIQTINRELEIMQNELAEAQKHSNERKLKIQALQDQIATLEAKINEIKSLELAN